jgi:uncharacterized protein YndB with AHSA1/START domain
MSKEKLKVETNGNELITTRKFNAPRKLVFEAHADCKHLMNWWGPREWPLSYCKMDFRVGGTWHYCLKGPEGMGESWGKAIYKEIKAPEKLYYEDYFSDKDGNLNQQMPSTFVKTHFEEVGGATIVKSTATYRSKEDLQKVIDMGMTAGIEETLDRLDEYMEKLVAAH